jgi:hypothetical protein
VTAGGALTSNRQVWMDHIIWQDGRPVVQGPTRITQPAPVVKHE